MEASVSVPIQKPPKQETRIGSCLPASCPHFEGGIPSMDVLKLNKMINFSDTQ
jgi:hypothetical protein